MAPWPWIFAVNLPVCVLAMLGLRHLPEVPRNNVAFDGISALLSMATLGVFISGVDMMGADLLRGIGLVAIAAVLGIDAPRQRRPRRWCRWTCASAAGLCRGRVRLHLRRADGVLRVAALLQQVLGRPYLEVGMLMGAWPVGTALVAPLAGRLSDRYSPATMSGIGAATMVAGMLWRCCPRMCPMPHSGGHVRGGPGLRLLPDAEQPRHAVAARAQRAAGGLQATTRSARASAPPLVAIAFSLSAAHGPGLRWCWARSARAGGGGERHPLQPAADALAALPATT